MLVHLTFEPEPREIEAVQWFPDKPQPCVKTDECGWLKGKPYIRFGNEWQEVQAGDWVVTNLRRQKYRATKKVFESIYRPLANGEERKPDARRFADRNR